MESVMLNLMECDRVRFVRRSGSSSSFKFQVQRSAFKFISLTQRFIFVCSLTRTRFVFLFVCGSSCMLLHLLLNSLVYGSLSISLNHSDSCIEFRGVEEKHIPFCRQVEGMEVGNSVKKNLYFLDLQLCHMSLSDVSKQYSVTQKFY